MSKDTKWISIEEAPKDGTELIGWNGLRTCPIAYIEAGDEFNEKGWCDASYVQGGFLYYLNNLLDPPPLLFQYLPEPPTDA